jgi:hypothetical protein|tara:strand:- start:2652 stop:3278 length:627 start_codon:yes stop_codon:yes gene_type:complete
VKIAIFYHLYQTELSGLIYQQQMHRLHASGLMDACDFIHIGVVGEHELFSRPKKAQVLYNRRLTKDEGETVESVYRFCKLNPNYKVLFFHAKGASRQFVPQLHAWRMFLEYIVIDRWKECIKKLKTYDAVGAKLRMHPSPHFSGNFWWANADYVATLDESFLYTDGEHGKIDRELMIGTGDRFDPCDMHHVHKEMNMYDKIFTEDNYI